MRNWKLAFCLAISFFFILLPGYLAQKNSVGLEVHDLPYQIRCTLYDNDSLANLRCFFTPPSPSCFTVIQDLSMYRQGWDTLPQLKFWRKIMRLTRDSALISIPPKRTLIATITAKDWDVRSNQEKEHYKDSIRALYKVSNEDPIYITKGKRHYYHFQKTIPSFTRAIRIFKRQGVDPWFAQAILMIESPGKLQYSPVGAYGSFQLMEKVAIEQGLIVNDSIDEREDFGLAAMAAARLIRRQCLPQARRMLQKYQLAYKETDLWFRLLVLHIYHAGGGNVDGALGQVAKFATGIPIMQALWQAEYKGFKNASQNYSQIALAAQMELDRIIQQNRDSACFKQVNHFSFQTQ